MYTMRSKIFPLFFGSSFKFVLIVFFIISCKVPQKQSALQDVSSQSSFCNPNSCKQCLIPSFSRQEESEIRKAQYQRGENPRDNLKIKRLTEPFNGGKPSELKDNFDQVFNSNSPILLRDKNGKEADVEKYKYSAELKIRFRDKVHTLKYELYAMQAPTFVRYLHALSSVNFYSEGMRIGKFKGYDGAPLKLENEEKSYVLPLIGLDDGSSNISRAENVVKSGSFLKKGESLGCGDLIYPFYLSEDGNAPITPARINWYPCTFFERNRNEPKFHEGTWPENYYLIPLGKLVSDPSEFKSHENLLADIEKELNKGKNEKIEFATIESFEILRECDCCFNTAKSPEPWGLVLDRNEEIQDICLLDRKLIRGHDLLGPDIRLAQIIEQCYDKQQLICHYKKSSKTELYCRTQKISQPFECKEDSSKDNYLQPLPETQTEMPKGKIPFECYKKSGLEDQIHGVEQAIAQAKEAERIKKAKDQEIREKYPYKRPVPGAVF